MSVRTLYTDDQETILDAQRPVILTGIGDLTRRSDLLDRALIVRLPPIPEAARRTEEPDDLSRDLIVPELPDVALIEIEKRLRCTDRGRDGRGPPCGSGAAGLPA